MEWVKLEDCFEFIRNGANIKQFGNDGLPITRIETISDRTVNKEKVGYANIKYPEYSDYYLKYNDILMSHINSETHLGKVAIYKDKTGEVIIHGMNLLCLRSNEKFLADYLYYFFNSIIFKNQLNKIMKKSVNQASFNITNLKNLKVPNKSLSKQKNIVSILSKIETLIQTRQDQVQALDDLVESVYNITLNENNNLVKLKDYVKVNPAKSEIKDLDSNTLISFVPMEDVSENGELSLSKTKTIDEAYKGFTYFKDGDVVVAKITPCFENGKGALMKGLVNGIGFGTTEFHVLRSKDKNTINPVWLNHLTRTRYFRELGEIRMSGSAGQKRIGKDFVENFEFNLPPIEKQNLFASFVEKIEKQKQILNNSLKELTDLFDSLMQDAFDGSMFK